MKVNLRSLAFIWCLIVPSVWAMSAYNSWVVLSACLLCYCVGERHSRTVVHYFHYYTRFCEYTWILLCTICIELVAGTRVHVSYVDQRGQSSVAAYEHPVLGGPDLFRLIKAPKPGKTKVVIINHHSRIDWLYVYILAARTAWVSNLRVVLKDDLRRVPLFGVCMQLFAFMFLSRSWVNDESYIQKMIESLKWLEDSSVIQIYPEGTDLAKSSVERSQNFAKAHDLPVFSYVLNPRTTGLTAIKNMLGEDRIESIIDVTLGYSYGPSNQRPNELSLLTGNQPRKVHFLIQEFPFNAAGSSTTVPSDDETFSQWIHGRFALKEQLLSRFYTTNPVGFDEADVRAVLGKGIGYLSRDPDMPSKSPNLNAFQRFVAEFGWIRGVVVPFLQWIVSPFAALYLQCQYIHIPVKYMVLMDFCSLILLELLTRRLFNLQSLFFGVRRSHQKAA